MRAPYHALLGGALIAGLCAPSAFAQQPVLTLPQVTTTTNNASTTVTATGVFQQVWAATSNRLGCTIQNNGTHNMNVTEGLALASATTAKSVVLAPGQAYYCQVNGIVLKGLIAITGTIGETFYAAQY